MEKDKILFLDIDGTLAGEEWYVNNKPEDTMDKIDPHAVQLLNQLKGAKVVISSSWGEWGGRTADLLRKKGLELPIIGYTTHFHYEHEWACRGNEIEEWILRTYKGMGTQFGTEYGCENYDYVIFDDDQDMLLGQINHFVHVNSKLGLTQADIDKAKKILKYDNCN